jgi:hypothetical protein
MEPRPDGSTRTDRQTDRQTDTQTHRHRQVGRPRTCHTNANRWRNVLVVCVRTVTFGRERLKASLESWLTAQMQHAQFQYLRRIFSCVTVQVARGTSSSNGGTSADGKTSGSQSLRTSVALRDVQVFHILSTWRVDEQEDRSLGDFVQPNHTQRLRACTCRSEHTHWPAAEPARHSKSFKQPQACANKRFLDSWRVQANETSAADTAG